MKNILRPFLGICALVVCVFTAGSPTSAFPVNRSNQQINFAAKEEVEGTLEVIEECEETKWQTLYYLNTASERLSLHLSKKPDRNLLTGMKVRVKGVRSGSTLETEDLTSSVQTSDVAASSPDAGTSSLAVSTNPFGEQKTLVILVNFQDKATQPFTVDEARDVAFNQVSNYFREASYGQTWMTGDVYGWYTIPVSSTVCDTAAIATNAQQAAANAGANLSAYNHYVYAFPTNACSFTGLASLGGNPSQAWINNSFRVGVVGHEMGHNFGLYHSRSIDCGTVVLGSTCTTSEYGDNLDIMGMADSAHYNAFQKERLGWLGYGASPPIQTVTASGTYWIDAYETTTGTKALKVLKSIDPATGLRTWYYIEHRTATGFNSYLVGHDNVLGGVLVRTGSEGDGDETYLLDMTPETTAWWDPALIAGQSYTDPTAGVTINTISADNTGALVQITVSAQACTHVSPSVSVTPGQTQWLRSGSAFTYTVSVTNNEATGCSASDFNLTTNLPAGWAVAYTSPTLNIAPGGSATSSITVTSPAGAPDGSYSIGVNAANASNQAYAGSSSASYTIVSSLAVSAVSGSASYTRTQKASVTATVKAGGSPIAGAAVNFSLTKPNGTVVLLKTTTSSNGIAVFTYSFNRKTDPVGTYKVQANSSSGGLSGTATTSFTVTK
jgi:hypothetical protein